MPNEFQQTQEVLANIESSLDKMKEITVSSSTASMIDKLDKNWLAIKALFILIVFGFFSGVAVASLLWFHFQLDEDRFVGMQKQVTIMNERQEFLISWQKSIQEQIVVLHSPHFQAP